MNLSFFLLGLAFVVAFATVIMVGHELVRLWLEPDVDGYDNTLYGSPGEYNLAIGADAARRQTTQNYCISIGDGVSAPTKDHQLRIRFEDGTEYLADLPEDKIVDLRKFRAEVQHEIAIGRQSASDRIIATGAKPLSEEAFDAALSTARDEVKRNVHRIRVAEYRGAFFEAMALDLVRKGATADFEKQAWAAEESARQMTNGDAEDHAVYREAAEGFAKTVREAARR